MTATVVTSGSSVQGGTGSGQSFTTPAGVTASQRLLVGIMYSSNANTITAPGTGTWAEVTLPDNVITTSGGQLRVYECSDPASSTAYTFSFTSGRQTLGWLLLDGEDDSGASMISIASSLESVAGASHAPPSITLPNTGELVVDFFGFRQFSPDASTCSPPVAGLTWTEIIDTRGADGNNNAQLAINTATGGTGGATISTSPLITVDINEPAMVARVVIKSAAGGGVTIQDTSDGSGSGGASDGLSLGDGSSGGGTGGAADGVALGGGSSAGGSGGAGDGLTLGNGSGGSGSAAGSDPLILGNGFGGSGAGGSGDGLVLGDGSGSSGSAGSADGVLAGAVISDTSGGSGSGSGADGLQLGGSSGGSGSASSGDTISGGPVTISDTSGGSGSGGSPDAVSTSGVVHDTMAMPIALNAHACLLTEVGKLEFPPSKVMIRPGAVFTAMADQVGDECCGGVAWVRLGQQTPTTAHWPDPLSDVDPPARGVPSYYSVQLELGIIRCVPVQSDQPDEAGESPTAAQWLQSAQEFADDAAALRRTVCCLQGIYGTDGVLAGPIAPLQNEGDCGGQTVLIQVRAPACDCVDTP